MTQILRPSAFPQPHQSTPHPSPVCTGRGGFRGSDHPVSIVDPDGGPVIQALHVSTSAEGGLVLHLEDGSTISWLDASGAPDTGLSFS